MEELNGKEFSTLKEFHDFFDNAKKIDRQSFVVRSSYPITKVQKELVQKLNGEEVSLDIPKYSKILFRCAFGPERPTTSKGIRKIK